MHVNYRSGHLERDDIESSCSIESATAEAADGESVQKCKPLGINTWG